MVFKFRFQQLLDISLFEEDEIKNRLTAKNAQIAEITARLTNMKRITSAILPREQKK